MYNSGGKIKMVTMFAKHKVGDYSSWKRVYDEVEPLRKEKGVTAASVHRDANDVNTIVITHQFKTLDAAMGFANSEELKSAMAKAGVNGSPEFWFTEDVEHTQY
jgi:quinol monooxygenase YgiN